MSLKVTFKWFIFYREKRTLTYASNIWLKGERRGVCAFSRNRLMDKNKNFFSENGTFIWMTNNNNNDSEFSKYRIFWKRTFPGTCRLEDQAKSGVNAKKLFISTFSIPSNWYSQYRDNLMPKWINSFFKFNLDLSVFLVHAKKTFLNNKYCENISV